MDNASTIADMCSSPMTGEQTKKMPLYDPWLHVVAIIGHFIVFIWTGLSMLLACREPPGAYYGEGQNTSLINKLNK